LRREVADHAPEFEKLHVAEPFAVWRDGGVAVLQLKRFISQKEVEQALDKALTPRPEGLILDLRWNPGASFAVMCIAEAVLDEPATVGVFFSRKVRNAALDGKWDDFPRRSEFDWDKAVHEAIHKRGVIVAEVKPVNEPYDGPMAVLTSKQTTAGCEALAELLKRRRRATLVGEQTAGQVLFNEEFDVGQGWRLVLPTADYVTADKRRLEGEGVAPDVSVGADEAYDRAKDLLVNRSMAHR
jgi:C-terminal processing protease CtpA/Prc